MGNDLGWPWQTLVRSIHSKGWQLDRTIRPAWVKPRNLLQSQSKCLSGWWQLKYFYFHPYLGKIPNLTNMFKMGWNHQLYSYDLSWLVNKYVFGCYGYHGPKKPWCIIIKVFFFFQNSIFRETLTAFLRALRPPKLLHRLMTRMFDWSKNCDQWLLRPPK